VEFNRKPDEASFSLMWKTASNAIVNHRRIPEHDLAHQRTIRAANCVIKRRPLQHKYTHARTPVLFREIKLPHTYNVCCMLCWLVTPGYSFLSVPLGLISLA
jgi:uncharacterized membrane protein YsdA (DUF1294 family)